MSIKTKYLLALGALIVGSAALAQCDPTLPRAQLVTCLMAQQQSQTGSMPHQSQFNNQNLQFQAQTPIYQQQAPTYQLQAPIYQQQMPTYQLQPLLPPNNRSSYR